MGGWVQIQKKKIPGHTTNKLLSGVFLYAFVVNRNTPLSIALTLLKPTGYVMHQQFNIQQFYVLPTLYLCVLYSSENKQRLVPLTA